MRASEKTGTRLWPPVVRQDASETWTAWAAGLAAGLARSVLGVTFGLGVGGAENLALLAGATLGGQSFGVEGGLRLNGGLLRLGDGLLGVGACLQARRPDRVELHRPQGLTLRKQRVGDRRLGAQLGDQQRLGGRCGFEARGEFRIVGRDHETFGDLCAGLPIC
ncbi:hypothetical protein CC_0666 [Caulobacter vibrioides CB15]|uniref:Uncharacterized protein n=1 Tax=Caulobacter vibrioides (strain ATCC 19089 / CIP 103742 / CB 15) TaxID=190650 RepID=Q9AAD6_CAUVC|nr:hypothetical protein CC_0666 [Caulobacter vibrioides CB15]ATC27509.1 hypothetical protein CA607_03545 [Caulobacter vibrioides]